MLIQELWSDGDEASQKCLLDALESDDLVGALLSLEGCDESAEREVRRTLNSWARRLEERCSDRESDEEVLSAFRAIFVDELHLAGDLEDYHAVANSLLSRVIRRRRGMPILLASIWIAVARLAGFTVEGVGLPGHFVVRIAVGDGLMCDPFALGRPLELDDCKAIVNRVGRGELQWRDDFLDARSDREIVERVLRNLSNSHLRDADPHALYRTTRLLLSVRPRAADVRLSYARLSEELGAFGEAMLAYEEVKETAESEHLVAEASRRLALVGARLGTLN